MRTTVLRMAAACGVLLLPLCVHAKGFNDNPEGIPYHQAIEDLQSQGILSGYADGSFRPERTLNRAEFLTILVRSQVPAGSRTCADPHAKPFTDVATTAWYFDTACVAKAKGIVEGYADGGFRPGATITFGEAAKMMAVAFGQKPADAAPWYKPYVAYLAGVHAIAPSLGSTDQTVTRGEMAEMLWRLSGKKTGLPSPTLEAILSAKCVEVHESVIPHVDLQEVQHAWLQWYNAARAAEHLPAYAYDRQLERTAYVWSSRAAAQGSISHKRPGQTQYYDYAMIGDWFKNLGLQFQNDHRATFTENIGTGYYACAKADCTADMIKAVKTTFDFFMAERAKSYRPHYNSIMNAYFRQIGVGIVVDQASKKYYLTVHYATSITSDPAPVCL
jgi:uncharacterized protein YkwD